MNTNMQQPLRKRASLINHPPQPYVGDLPTRPLTSEPLPQRQHVSNKSHIVRTSDDTVFKEKVSDAFSSLQSRKTVSFLFRVVILLALLITIFLIKNQTQYQGHAAGLSKDLYGIASGSNLTGFSSTNLNTYLNDYQTVGAQWIRNDFSWAGIQPNSPTSYNWTPYDTVVSAVNAHGLKVLGVLLTTPTWELPSGCTDYYHCPPKSNADYATFAAAVVARYAPMGVHYWEIWNEPNDGTFSPASYTAMLQAAYPAIKHADPTAFVLAGGSMPNSTGTGGYSGNYSPIDFLTGMYQSGAKAYFDALAHHPYCWSSTFNCPTQYASWSAWSQMQDTSPSLRSVMTANSDSAKQIWATEFGAPTGGDNREGPWPVTESQQAQMVNDAYTLFNSYSWAGPLFWYTYLDPCTDTTNPECFFGLVHNDYTPKPAYYTYQSLATNAGSSTSTPTLTLTPTATPTFTPTPMPTATNTPVPTTFTPTPTPIDTLPPTVTILTPLNDSTVSRHSNVTLTASASDDVGVTQVSYFITGSLLCTTTVSPYFCSWSVPGKPNASYTITAKAYNAAGMTGANSVTVTAK